MRRSRFSALGLAVRDRSGIRLGDEAGMALVMALGIMLVLGVTLTTVITFTAAGARDSGRVNAGQKAYALAEAGLNNALAVLHANYPDSTNQYPGNRCLLRPQPVPAGFPGTTLWADERSACAALAGEDPVTAYTSFVSTPDDARPTETVEWWGRIRNVAGLGPSWIITSTGSLPNPTGPGLPPVTRTVRAKVPVIFGEPDPSDPGILNWLYSPTNTTFGQTVHLFSPLYVIGNFSATSASTINAPLYVTCAKPPVAKPTVLAPCGVTGGNVSLSQSAAVKTPATLSVGGTVTLNNTAYVGTVSERLPEAHVVKGCPAEPCGWDSSGIYVDPARRDRIMPDDPVPVPPVIDWDFWLSFAAPGPNWACDPATKSGATPDFTSLTARFDLIQSTAYTCRATVGETIIGELSWDPNHPDGTDMDGTNSGLLTVHGTIYIPGSLFITKLGGRDVFRYSGKGTIYVGGTIAINNVQLCATLAKYQQGGTGPNKWWCDTRPYAEGDPAAWDTAKNALVLAAKDRGGYIGAANSVEVVSSQFQGVLAGTYTIEVTTSSIVQGPMISTDGSVSLNQSTGASFPSIRFPPASTPGKPPPPSVLLAPREFGGG